MRYYEYLSSSKVEMLYPQIDQSSRSAGGEIGVDLKVFRFSRKTDGARTLSIHDKLAAVEDWIYAHEPVGTVDEPDVWIYGRANLVATTLTLMDRGAPVSGPVLFTPAEAAPGSELLMGGSAHNTAGQRAYPDMELPAQVRYASARVELLNVLGRFAADLGLSKAPNSQEPYGHDEWTVISGLARLLRSDRNRMPNWLNSVFDDFDVFDRPAFDAAPPVLIGECEFLAKRLRTWTEQVHSGAIPEAVTLATPLFVAVID
jgi:hypothetical protein